MVTAEQYAPPNMHGPVKFKVVWAGEYHLKLFDNTKNTDELFWSEDLVGVKWPDNRQFGDYQDTLRKCFKYNEEYMVWERNALDFNTGIVTRKGVIKCWCVIGFL